MGFDGTPPPNPEYRTAEIAWSKPGKYVRILGIPFWEGKDYDPREFWIERYDKMKAMLARWPNLGALSLVGRRNIANSMVIGYVDSVTSRGLSPSPSLLCVPRFP